MLRRLRSKARRLRNCGWRLRQQKPLAAATAAEGRVSGGGRDCGQGSRQRLPEAAPTEASGRCGGGGGGGGCSHLPAAVAIAARGRASGCQRLPRRRLARSHVEDLKLLPYMGPVEVTSSLGALGGWL